MPRANRCILPGEIYHLTHRCHDRAFLFRFAVDRIEYCRRLRDAVKEHRVSLLDFNLTCNHTHLLAVSNRPRDISRMMQQLEGEFAEYYNRKKERRGAFWDDHFHCTMVQSGTHLLNCLLYIDLNMVRARVVSHPREWQWCGYQELVGLRERYCILDVDRLLKLLDIEDFGAFVQAHEARINTAIMEGIFLREPRWTEGFAVGNEHYVREMASRLPRRKRLRFETTKDGTWYVKEDPVEYDRMIQREVRANFCKLRLELHAKRLKTKKEYPKSALTGIRQGQKHPHPR